jgi:bifunctional non-homologous end joining protein LigD
LAWVIASLYVGRREKGRLLYAGKARSGYTEAVARDLRERLDPCIRKASPLSVPVRKPKATWVDPVIDAEIEYSTVTTDGSLREAVFKGLREDREVMQRTRPVKGAKKSSLIANGLEAAWLSAAARRLSGCASD